MQKLPPTCWHKSIYQIWSPQCRCSISEEFYLSLSLYIYIYIYISIYNIYIYIYISYILDVYNIYNIYAWSIFLVRFMPKNMFWKIEFSHGHACWTPPMLWSKLIIPCQLRPFVQDALVRNLRVAPGNHVAPGHGHSSNQGTSSWKYVKEYEKLLKTYSSRRSYRLYKDNATRLYIYTYPTTR